MSDVKKNIDAQNVPETEYFENFERKFKIGNIRNFNCHSCVCFSNHFLSTGKQMISFSIIFIHCLSNQNTYFFPNMNRIQMNVLNVRRINHLASGHGKL